MDDTARGRMAVYSDVDIEKMGAKRLSGLLRSDRTSQHQKIKIMKVLKSRGLALKDDVVVLW